ncbi:phosphatidate cytidylyltransferase [Roseibium sp.]|uniref:phosphatidate cytidylyltransferase n=1 Tax=Roseibium sp. TaxID=1936156 RepID=UPI003D0A0A30
MAEAHPPKKNPSNLTLRVLSAAVLGPLVLFITYLGGLPFALLMLPTTMLLLWEWFSITGTRHTSASALSGQAALVVLAVLDFIGYRDVGLGVVLLGAAATYAAAGFSRTGRWGAEGVLYSGCALYAFLSIRNGTGGLLYTFFLLFVVWATDIFAYFAGRAIGGPKLWPRVSPKKTWSGAIGGLVLATAFGVGVVYVAGGQSLGYWMLLAIVLSIVSQAGDLLESSIKRRFDVKDSSQIIPGHGGIMDRVDGLVAAAIFAALIGILSGGTLMDPIAGFGLG